MGKSKEEKQIENDKYRNHDKPAPSQSCEDEEADAKKNENKKKNQKVKQDSDDEFESQKDSQDSSDNMGSNLESMQDLVNEVNKAEDGHYPSQLSPSAQNKRTQQSSYISHRGADYSNHLDKDFNPLREVLDESFYEDEDSSEDEGMPDYKIGGYHPIHVGEILLDRYVII